MDIRYDKGILRFRVGDDGVGMDSNLLTQGTSSQYGVSPLNVEKLPLPLDLEDCRLAG